jgi:hypothetical protein
MEGVQAIPELVVLGQPVMCVFAYGAKDKRVSCYAIGDYLERKGWHIDRLQKPESIHLMLNPGHGQIVDSYVGDLREAVAYVKEHPDAALEGSAPMYGLIAKAPMRRLVRRNVLAILEQMYSAAGGTPNLGNVAGEGEEGQTSPPGVPKILLQAMKLKARLDRMFGRK